MNSFYKLLLLFFFLPLSLQAQKLDHVLGDLLIQVPKGVSIRTAIKDLQTFKNKRTHIVIKKNVVPFMNVWLIHIDYNAINEIHFLQYVKSQKLSQVAQFNHLIENRNTPNDPRFDQQWQYINDGSNGGVVNADLDADLAWDVTTGGLTALGDTIVVCVIDDGLDDDHSDIVDNLWFNHQEIPNNNKDDDGNGYVDDYRGWDTYLEDDNISRGGVHGTQVTGIIGAKGNNGLGVAGVNWDVKIMYVRGGGTEALALAAYAYPYSFRKKYNETGGQAGAFVVATNASWGVPNQQAADAPIWCSFYDSLGVQGILNVAATANSNVNIDSVGDMPTTCSSNFLISVTNVTRAGEKFSRAGYGSTHIDLGAFGQETYTMSINNSYGNFGGTSAATPHVTGTIGLLYAAPCPYISSLALNDPQSAALIMRQYILEGVVPEVTLDGITVTGGRLNINNSMQLLMDNCESCPPPSLIQLSELTGTKVKIDWVQSDSVVQVDMQWRALGTNDWQSVTNISSPYIFQNLTSCTHYEFELKSSCSDTTSIFSKRIIFESDGCCRPPSDLFINNITTSTVTANWSSVLAAIRYNLQYRIVGAANWITTNTTSSSLDLTNLTACTNYEIQIQTVCDTGATLFAPVVLFKTFGCGNCIDLSYCESRGVDANNEWIDRVQLNTLDNNSGKNDGYGDFTGLQSTQLEILKAYDIILSPGYASQHWNEYFKVWIDYNQDGDFEDESEEVFDPETVTDTTLIGNFTIPATAKLGATRMRVSMEFAGFSNENKPTACERTIEIGEVEDYCVDIVEGQEFSCLVPQNFSSKLITTSAATIEWDNYHNIENYVLNYKNQEDDTWKEVEVDTNFYRLSGLSQCSNYDVRVQTQCSLDSLSAFSEVYTFHTTCPCFAPASFDTISTDETTAHLFWQATANANSYLFRFRQLGTNDWLGITVENDTININDLSKCTNYQYQIASVCLGNTSNFSDIGTFQTKCGSSTDYTSELNQLSLFPNPFQNNIHLSFDLQQSTSINISIWNLNGQQILEKDFDRLTIGTHRVTLEQLDLSSGIYFVKITTDSSALVRKMISQ